MTKVTIQEASVSPAAQLVARATAETTVTDAKGRVLTLRRPGVLAQFRLIEALGPETARNGVYVNMVLPLIYLAAIDGDSAIAFGKKSEIEALIQRLDEEGIEALGKGVVKHFGEQDPDAEKAKLGN